jgi:hypothetical protein
VRQRSTDGRKRALNRCWSVDAGGKPGLPGTGQTSAPARQRNEDLEVNPLVGRWRNQVSAGEKELENFDLDHQRSLKRAAPLALILRSN